MLGGLISGILTAFILVFLGVDTYILEMVQPYVNTTLTVAHIYICLGAIGLIGGAFKR